MGNPIISVIMSTYKTKEEYLKESIESILNQSFKNFEFIIICDGSEEDLEIIKQYKDDRIKIINHSKSIGLTKSLNEALKIAKGEYIARMDSDDISLKNRFETQVDFLEKNPNVSICSTYTKNIGYRKDLNVNIFNTIIGVKTQLFLSNIVAHPSVIIRKRFLEDNNIFYDESFKYSQDYELWTRCSKITDIYIIPKICLFYRMHQNQISTAKIEEQNALSEKIYLRNLQELGIENSEEKVKYMLFLSGKKNEQYSTQELLDFVDEVISCNEKKIIYDSKILKKLLIYKIFVSCIKNKKYISLKYIFQGSVISIYLRKKFLEIKNKGDYSVK